MYRLHGKLCMGLFGTYLDSFLGWNEFVKWLALVTAENYNNLFHLWHHWKTHGYSLLQNPDDLCQLLETLAMDASSSPMPAVSNFISIYLMYSYIMQTVGWCFLFVRHHYALNFTWVMAKFGPCLEKTMSEEVWMAFRSLVFQTVLGCNKDNELWPKHCIFNA